MRLPPGPSRSPSRPTRTVLIDVNLAYEYGRGVIAGVSEFRGPDRPWHLVLVPYHQRITSETIQWTTEQGYQPDGVIAQLANPAQMKPYTGSGLPIVNISARCEVALPTVRVDDEAVGRMAAQHLLDLGLRHFGFVEAAGVRGDLTQRARGFARRVAEAGHRCHRLRIPLSRKPKAFIDRFGPWLDRFPKPCGLMTTNDAAALQIATACRVLDVPVPEEVALIGVDNDPLVCEHATPPLSSVELPLAKIGFEAAAALERLMDGDHVEPTPRRLPPVGVVVRRSTDLVAVDDPHVSRMLRYIRDHACEGITVADVVRQAPITRRWAEKRFRDTLGRTPAEEIRRVRIEHAEACLTQTDLTLAEVAFRCGFANHTRFGVVFRQVTGTTPAAFRRQHRAHA